MYLETGNTGTAGRLDFSFGSVTAARMFDVKVTYIECNSLTRQDHRWAGGIVIMSPPPKKKNFMKLTPGSNLGEKPC